MIILVLLAAAGVVGYGLFCWANAARQGRASEWFALWRAAWRRS